MFSLRETALKFVELNLKLPEQNLSIYWDVIIAHHPLRATGVSLLSSLNNFYSPSFSFMHNIPTDCKIIMKPASLVSSILSDRLSFELQVTRHSRTLFRTVRVLVTPRLNEKG